MRECDASVDDMRAEERLDVALVEEMPDTVRSPGVRRVSGSNVPSVSVLALSGMTVRNGRCDMSAVLVVY